MFEINYINLVSVSLVGTGLIFCVRIVHILCSKKCKCIPNIKKTIVITGATSGLGEACAVELSKRNCRLILGCRNQQLGNNLVERLRKSNEASDVKMIYLDLSDLESIRNFSETVNNEKIDVLINNAGVMAGHFRMIQSTKTEEDMAVNYLGHFYLTNLLLPNLRTAYLDRNSAGDSHTKFNSSRIIFISSSLSKYGRLDIGKFDLSKDPYNPKQAYSNSKLALNIFAQELHKRYHVPYSNGDSNVNILTMYTGGMVNTRLSRHIISTYSVLLQPFLRIFLRLFLKTSEQACHPILHCALSNDLKDSSGELYANFKSIPWPQNMVESETLSSDLWIKSCEIVGLKEQ